MSLKAVGALACPVFNHRRARPTCHSRGGFEYSVVVGPVPWFPFELSQTSWGQTCLPSGLSAVTNMTVAIGTSNGFSVRLLLSGMKWTIFVCSHQTLFGWNSALLTACMFTNLLFKTLVFSFVLHN